MTQLRLLLKFANYDSGKRDEIDFDDSATVAELKQHILSEHWPSTGVAEVTSTDDFRLLCQGKSLSDGTKSLKAAGVPKLNFATPVHIAVSQKAMRRAGGLDDSEGCCVIQ